MYTEFHKSLLLTFLAFDIVMLVVSCCVVESRNKYLEWNFARRGQRRNGTKDIGLVVKYFGWGGGREFQIFLNKSYFSP